MVDIHDIHGCLLQAREAYHCSLGAHHKDTIALSRSLQTISEYGSFQHVSIASCCVYLQIFSAKPNQDASL